MEVYFEAFRDRDNHIHIIKLHRKRFEAHFHSNIEVLYVEKGELEVSIGGDKRILTRGAVAVAESYAVHSLSASEDADVRVAIIPVMRVPDFSLRHRNLTFATPFLDPCARSAEIGVLFRSFDGFDRRRSPMIGKGFAYLLLGMLTDALGTVPAPHRTKDGVAVVGQMLRYMDEHYTEPLTLERLAGELGYHKDYLSRVFNETIHTGFCRYLSTMRLRYAVQLIRTTDLSLEEIADRAGFGNPHSFYDAFRDVYQCTPGQYRKRIGSRTTVAKTNE
ncbi:MAG: helix-turn-helix transcriptional regulator [Clostridia bacterium]|nr:helix-turn-helix transcriptional regulator [Clostridia bacterium]